MKLLLMILFVAQTVALIFACIGVSIISLMVPRATLWRWKMLPSTSVAHRTAQMLWFFREGDDSDADATR